MIATCASCNESIESDDWNELRGDVYHRSGSCRDLYLRRRDRLVVTAIYGDIKGRIWQRIEERLGEGPNV